MRVEMGNVNNVKKNAKTREQEYNQTTGTAFINSYHKLYAL